MKIITAFVCIFLVSFGIVQADVYVKGIVHIGGGYRYGHNVPDVDVVNEWWINKNKITFISKGWQYNYLGSTDWRLTLNKDKQHILVVNLSEKSFIEVSLPMNILSCVNQDLAEGLKIYQIEGKVEKVAQKENIFKKTCDVYKVTEWISRGDDNFYERERIVRITTDVPFDWKIINELYQWIASFFNPQKSYLSGLKKMKGFVLAEENILFELAGQIKWSLEVVEISQKKALQGIYDPPKDFKKKEKFSIWELFHLGILVYPIPCY